MLFSEKKIRFGTILNDRTENRISFVHTPIQPTPNISRKQEKMIKPNRKVKVGARVEEPQKDLTEIYCQLIHGHLIFRH
jgi:hypothetical protein